MVLKFSFLFSQLIPIVAIHLFFNERALEAHEQTPKYNPMFIGSLLGLTPINMKPGHPVIEPTIKIINTYGSYTSSWSLKTQTPQWSISPLIDFQFGFTDRTGLETIVSFSSNFKGSASSTHLEDTQMFLGFQIACDNPTSWLPDIRINLQETIPTGNYQKLSSKNLGTDSTGEGSFQTGFNLISQKRFSLTNNYLNLKVSIGMLFPKLLNVKGLSTYGGCRSTHGKIQPGKKFSAYFSGEYSFNQNWVFAFDTIYLYQGSSQFFGKKGINQVGKSPEIGNPSSVQLSFAPQMEYNISPGLGVITGIWFTVLGRNSNAFVSGFIAALYVF